MNEFILVDKNNVEKNCQIICKFNYNDKNYNRPNYVEKETHLSSGRNDKGSNHDRVKDYVKLNSRNPEKQSQKSNSRNSSRADKTDTNKNARTTRN